VIYVSRQPQTQTVLLSADEGEEYGKARKIFDEQKAGAAKERDEAIAAARATAAQK
jgi:hypothetical protein